MSAAPDLSSTSPALQTSRTSMSDQIPSPVSEPLQHLSRSKHISCRLLPSNVRFEHRSHLHIPVLELLFRRIPVCRRSTLLEHMLCHAQQHQPLPGTCHPRRPSKLGFEVSCQMFQPKHSGARCIPTDQSCAFGFRHSGIALTRRDARPASPSPDASCRSGNTTATGDAISGANCWRCRAGHRTSCTTAPRTSPAGTRQWPSSRPSSVDGDEENQWRVEFGITLNGSPCPPVPYLFGELHSPLLLYYIILEMK